MHYTARCLATWPRTEQTALQWRKEQGNGSGIAGLRQWELQRHNPEKRWWTAVYWTVLKKIVRISFCGVGNLDFHGDGSRNKRGTRLNIISCTKAQKYLLQGCHLFLAHITVKETGDKSKKKQLQDVPVVKNFPEVFPEDLPGLPPTRQVEFHIDLVPVFAPVARAPYRFGPIRK
ncbi:hypothetical protein Tco_0906801 [Tanacetum coccineum]|uniref:Reverse transcriptase domain-containing protein n=1 Tax=Tanacetum coccineum TaxID=301880 RepID=A0ABQ5CHG7_9ASTR